MNLSPGLLLEERKLLLNSQIPDNRLKNPDLHQKVELLIVRLLQTGKQLPLAANVKLQLLQKAKGNQSLARKVDWLQEQRLC